MTTDLNGDPQSKVPIPNSYWVVPGKLLAGEYPGAHSDRKTVERLASILGAGITCFIDLTQEDESILRPYASVLRQLATDLPNPVEYRRMSIPDMRAPAPGRMREILDAVDAAVAAGHVVYLHCLGGLGRTGTVVGCYLVRHGLSGQEALDELSRLRQDTLDAFLQSPQTIEQVNMVLGWGELERPG